MPRSAVITGMHTANRPSRLLVPVMHVMETARLVGTEDSEGSETARGEVDQARCCVWDWGFNTTYLGG